MEKQQMLAQLAKFQEEFKNSAELRNQVQNIQSERGAKEFMAKYFSGADAEEVMKFMAELSANAGEKTELSDDELENVAGGSFRDKLFGFVAYVPTAVYAGGAAAFGSEDAKKEGKEALSRCGDAAKGKTSFLY